MEGYHDDYYISSIIATVDTNGIRMPERVKAGKFVINGGRWRRSRRRLPTASASSSSGPRRL